MNSNYSVEQLQSLLQQMDPYQLEVLVGRLWEAKGYQITVKKGSGDKGIDIVATNSDPFARKQLLQVKRYSGTNSIGSQAVRVYATLYNQEDDVELVAIITTGGFTSQALELARDLRVRTMDGNRLAEELLKELDTDEIAQYVESEPADREETPESEPADREETPESTTKQPDRPDNSIECRYCEAWFTEEVELRKHLHNEHDRSELSRIDRRRVDHYVKNMD
jgi:restriction endonuclease Mrr